MVNKACAETCYVQGMKLTIVRTENEAGGGGCSQRLYPAIGIQTDS